MNAQPSNQIIPVWTLSDRMNKAMHTAGLSISDMTILLGVHRNTISGYIHGRIQPDEETIKAWAEHTRVLHDWIKYGSDQPAQLRAIPGVSKRKRKNQNPSVAVKGDSGLPDPAEYLQKRLRLFRSGSSLERIGSRSTGRGPRSYRCPSR
jgi:hypothetical protein